MKRIALIALATFTLVGCAHADEGKGMVSDSPSTIERLEKSDLAGAYRWTTKAGQVIYIIVKSADEDGLATVLEFYKKEKDKFEKVFVSDSWLGVVSLGQERPESDMFYCLRQTASGFYFQFFGFDKGKVTVMLSGGSKLAPEHIDGFFLVTDTYGVSWKTKIYKVTVNAVSYQKEADYEKRFESLSDVTKTK